MAANYFGGPYEMYEKKSKSTERDAGRDFRL